MGKFKKSQILILSLIVVLLSLTPFLSTSIRSTHLYIVINILILTVGVEAGLLSAFSKTPNEEKKPIITNVNSTTKIVTPLVKESNLEKKISTDADEDPVKAEICCSSGSSIFFISNGEIEEDEVLKDEEEGIGDAIAEEELSTKADTFISNFYKQLKMQREESKERITLHY